MGTEIIVEDRVEFAVTPKLFGKWSYDGVQCSEQSLIAYLNVKSTKAQVYVPYTAGKYQKNDSRRSNAQLPRDSPINSWLVCIDKMVKSKPLSESSDKVLRLSTSLPDKTHSRFSLKLLYKEELERIQPESVPEVPSEDKPSMSLH